ncbi:hypothetical protein T09_10089 [Trichinella sp. T9]|nr:hypothetical protein T09_10089 [Trichinella sp. T9]
MMLLIFLTSYLYILCREQLLLEMDPQRAVVLKLFWAATHFRNDTPLRTTSACCEKPEKNSAFVVISN